MDISSAPDSFKRCLPEKERQKIGFIDRTQENAEKRYAAGQEKQLQDDIEIWLRSQPFLALAGFCLVRNPQMRKIHPDPIPGSILIS